MDKKNQDAENDNRVNAKHSTPAHSRIANVGGGAEEFQHRAAAHHRDVHDLDVSFYRP